MPDSPKQILLFLANNYERIKELFDSCKNSRIVSTTTLEQFEMSPKFTKKLTDYKILQPFSDGHYRFEKHYFTLLAFLISDFSLALPVEFASYKETFEEMFLKLKEATEWDQKNFFVHKIIDAISDFLALLQENTNALNKEVGELQNTPNERMSYTKRISKASNLMNQFLKPLNRILDDEHEDSIVVLIRSMIGYVYSKAIDPLDRYEEEAYGALHMELKLVQEEIEKHLYNMVNSLIPFLEEIKASNSILRGLRLLRDYYEQGQDHRYACFLPKLVWKKDRNITIASNHRLAAQNVIEAYVQQRPIFVYAPSAPKLPWYFREDYYHQKLHENLPISNFFLWCYQTLQKEERTPIDLNKFFSMANLVFKTTLKVSLTEKRQALQLADARITVPHINIQPTSS